MSNFWGAYQVRVLTSVSTRKYFCEYVVLISVSTRKYFCMYIRKIKPVRSLVNYNY